MMSKLGPLLLVAAMCGPLFGDITQFDSMTNAFASFSIPTSSGYGVSDFDSGPSSAVASLQGGWGQYPAYGGSSAPAQATGIGQQNWQFTFGASLARDPGSYPDSPNGSGWQASAHVDEFTDYDIVAPLRTRLVGMEATIYVPNNVTFATMASNLVALQFGDAILSMYYNSNTHEDKVHVYRTDQSGAVVQSEWVDMVVGGNHSLKLEVVHELPFDETAWEQAKGPVVSRSVYSESYSNRAGQTRVEYQIGNGGVVAN